MLVLLAVLSLPWLYLKVKGSTQSGPEVKSQTHYGMSDKGWTDFSYWMSNQFIPHIPPARPVLLLLDGHSSHYEPDTIHLAAKEGIVIICIPPHTTHVSQPLDISFFQPLKAYWSEACHKYMQENPGRVVTKYQFSELFGSSLV